MAKTVKRTPRAILRADSDGMTLRKLTARAMSQADNQSQLPIYAQQQTEQLIAAPKIRETRYHVVAWITAARRLQNLGTHFPVRTGNNSHKTGCEPKDFFDGGVLYSCVGTLRARLYRRFLGAQRYPRTRIRRLPAP